MQPPAVLTVHLVPHPNPKVQRIDFELSDGCVEHVYAGVIGPTSVLLLRRLPLLWRHREPALVDFRELGLSLGLGASMAPRRTIQRLVHFGLAHWLPGDEVGARTQIAPVQERQLRRLLEWTRQVHERLLGAHLDQLAVDRGDRTVDADRTPT